MQQVSKSICFLLFNISIDLFNVFNVPIVTLLTDLFLDAFEEAVDRFIQGSTSVRAQGFKRIDEHCFIEGPFRTNRLAYEIANSCLWARRRPLHRLRASPTGGPSSCLAWLSATRMRLIKIMDMLNPLSVLVPEIHHARFVHLSGRE